MNLINPSVAVIDHLRTLFEGRSRVGRLWVVFLFYGVPLMFGSLCFQFKFKIDADDLATLITVFSVFAALLLSAQISAFTMANRDVTRKGDETLAKVQEKKNSDFKVFLKQLNANISYLILVACSCLLVFFFLSVSGVSEVWMGSIAVGCVTHFFGTLLMVLKRTHIAFRVAYE